MKPLLLILFSALITAVSQILLKVSADKKYQSVIFEYLNPYVIVSYALFVFVLGLNVFIFRTVDYRYGIVLNSVPTVMVLLLSCFILKEKITKRRVIGNIVILLGVIIFMM